MKRAAYRRSAGRIGRRLFDRGRSVDADAAAIYSVVLEGGLGNRLFQLASIYGLSRLHNARFVISDAYVYGNSHSSRCYARYYERFRVEEVPHFEKYCEDPRKALSYVEIPPQQGHILFQGFFQSERYFLHLREDIIRLFGPRLSERWHIRRRYGNLQNAAFVHVRLGDFIGDALHEIDLSEYYQYCLEDLQTRLGPRRVLLFSDDPQGCLERMPFLARYELVQEPNEITALYAMSSCGLGGICANSTFSWWGAWLNPSKRKQVYLPSKWLNDANRAQDGIVMRDSIVVDLERIDGRTTVKQAAN